jgi:hypothetical protein
MFSLRIGMGYGSVFLPNLGLVHPTAIPLPELEMFFRF